MAYLDHAASAPVRPEALEAMVAVLTNDFGNPSGGHRVAQRAKQALEEARERVAECLGANPAEIVFTSGGTEADALAVDGVTRAAGPGAGVVTTAFEHKAVLGAAARLEREGVPVARVGVDAGGVVDVAALADALDEHTALVSVMLVNNEVGTIQPLAEVATVVRERAPQAVLHTDAVQAVPWVDVRALAADAAMISISGHKFGSPKGTGALVVRDGVALTPLVEGGGQERDRRAGTVNVAGAVAMAVALELTVRHRAEDVARIGALRDRLVGALLDACPGSFVNGDPARKIAGNCHVGFPGVEAEVLLMALDRSGVAAAAGSSCSSGATELSHVLVAMGMTASDARSCIRLSLGPASTDDDVDRVIAAMPGAVDAARRGARR